MVSSFAGAMAFALVQTGAYTASAVGALAVVEFVVGVFVAVVGNGFDILAALYGATCSIDDDGTGHLHRKTTNMARNY